MNWSKNDFWDRQYTRGFILSTLTLEGMDPRLDEINPPLRWPGDVVDSTAEATPLPITLTLLLAFEDSPGSLTCRRLFTALCNLSNLKLFPSKKITPSRSLQSSLFPWNETLGLPAWLLQKSTVTLFSAFLNSVPGRVVSIDAGLNSSATKIFALSLSLSLSLFHTMLCLWSHSLTITVVHSQLWHY